MDDNSNQNIESLKDKIKLIQTENDNLINQNKLLISILNSMQQSIDNLIEYIKKDSLNNEKIIPVNEKLITQQDTQLTIEGAEYAKIDNLNELNDDSQMFCIERAPKYGANVAENESESTNNENSDINNESSELKNDSDKQVKEELPLIKEKLLSIKEKLPPIKENLHAINENIQEVNENKPPTFDDKNSSKESVRPQNENIKSFIDNMTLMKEKKKIIRENLNNSFRKKYYDQVYERFTEEIYYLNNNNKVKLNDLLDLTQMSLPALMRDLKLFKNKKWVIFYGPRKNGYYKATEECQKMMK